MNKPLKKNPSVIVRRKVVKVAAQIIKVVCKTLHPNASEKEIVQIAEDSVNELKSVLSDQNTSLNPTLKSIVDQYQKC